MGKKIKAGHRVLVAGASGMLGTALVPLLLEGGYEVVTMDLPELDITDLYAVREVVRGASPAAIINCAAYTAVDRAEDDRAKAMAVNAEGAANLARAASEVGARLVYISTDFVFDGTKDIPYKEDDEASPLSVYGLSKLKGEEEAALAGGDHLIVRTSWLYGPGNANFVSKIAEKAVASKELSVVFDQIGTPSSTGDLSQAIINLIQLDLESGTYHFSNEGVASWYDFAVAVVDGLRARGVPLMVEHIEPVLSTAYKTPAARPPYSVMDKTKYKKATGALVRHWQEALSDYLDLITEGGALKL